MRLQTYMINHREIFFIIWMNNFYLLRLLRDPCFVWKKIRTRCVIVDNAVAYSDLALYCYLMFYTGQKPKNDIVGQWCTFLILKLPWHKFSSSSIRLRKTGFTCFLSSSKVDITHTNRIILYTNVARYYKMINNSSNKENKITQNI